MVGFYIGKCKPKFDEVGLDLIDELLLHHPSLSQKGITIELDRLVADSPALQDLRGTAGPTGYWSLPRCKVPGINYRDEQGHYTGVRFADVNCKGKPRLDSEWDSYLASEGNTIKTTSGQPPVNDSHVKTMSLFTKVPGMKMVTNSVVEPMHAVDGGVLRDLAGRANKAVNTLTKEGHTSAVKTQFHAYTAMLANAFAPTEIQRRLTTLLDYEKWKARQTRNFFMYLALPAFHQFHGAFGDNPVFYEEQIQRVVVALRLIGGFSSQPVPQKDLDLAESLLQDFAEDMVKNCSELWATHKNHNIVHVTSDCRNKDCHLDRGSAYAAENYHQIEKRLIQRGGHTHIQIL